MLIKTISIYRFSLPRFIQHLLNLGQEERIFEGESINNDDDPKRFLFYIVNGSFRLCVAKPDGTIFDFAYCHEGTIIQKNDRTPYIKLCDLSRIVASENSVIVYFSKQQFFDILANDQELLNEFVSSISTYCVLLKEKTLMTAGFSSVQRVLNWLHKLCLGTAPLENNIYEVSCSLTQQQIANLLFIHLSTCNKIFSKLKNEGIAKYTKDKIIIYRHDLLITHLENDDW
jgi:CRP/FNR family cyclic AMP-dependent transcriptional regulator